MHHHIAETAAASPEKSKKATEESDELEQNARGEVRKGERCDDDADGEGVESAEGVRERERENEMEGRKLYIYL